MRMILLAAGTGSRLAPLTDDRPKCLVPLGGKPLLERNLDTARACGVSDLILVGGYRFEALHPLGTAGVTIVENPEFATTNMVHTLFCAGQYFGEGFIMSYGDIVYAPKVLESLLAQSDDGISVIVDRDWRPYWSQRSADPLSDAETMRIGPAGNILELGQRPRSLEEIEGQYIGLVRFGRKGLETLKAVFAELAAGPGADRKSDPRRMYMTDLIQAIIDRGTFVRAVDIRGGWLEIDTMEDLALAEKLAEEGRLS